jgi:hypothetical protein
MIKKILLFSLLILSFSGCVNKHGVSLKYYSDCKEYYDLQGYYHKDCGKDDLMTYKEMKDALKKKEKEPEGNVW